MPKRPNFYCDFYCAVWDGLRDPGTGWDETGSRHPLGRRSERVSGSLGGGFRGGIPDLRVLEAYRQSRSA